MRINQVARSVADAEELPRLIQLSGNLFAAQLFLNETGVEAEGNPDDGAFVQAWIWVSDEEAKQESP